LSGEDRELFPLPRIKPWIILPTFWSLYWLHYVGSQYNYLGQKKLNIYSGSQCVNKHTDITSLLIGWCSERTIFDLHFVAEYCLSLDVIVFCFDLTFLGHRKDCDEEECIKSAF